MPSSFPTFESEQSNDECQIFCSYTTKVSQYTSGQYKYFVE